MSFNLDYGSGTVMLLEIFVTAKVKLKNVDLELSLSYQSDSGQEALSSPRVAQEDAILQPGRFGWRHPEPVSEASVCVWCY